MLAQIETEELWLVLNVHVGEVLKDILGITELKAYSIITVKTVPLQGVGDHSCLLYTFKVNKREGIPIIL